MIVLSTNAENLEIDCRLPITYIVKIQLFSLIEALLTPEDSIEESEISIMS
jgi:hypothetical protein